MGVTAGTTPKIQHGRRLRVRACANATVGAATDVAVIAADASLVLNISDTHTRTRARTHTVLIHLYNIMSYARRCIYLYTYVYVSY